MFCSLSKKLRFCAKLPTNRACGPVRRARRGIILNEKGVRHPFFKLFPRTLLLKVGAKPARPHGVAPRAHADLRPYHRFTTFRESPDMPEPIRTRMGSFSAIRAIHLRIETLRTGMSGTEARGHVRPHPKGRLAAMENPGELAPSQTISFGGFPQPHARCAP